MLISTIGFFFEGPRAPALGYPGPLAPLAAPLKPWASLEFNFPPRNYSVYEISRGLLKKCGF